MIKLDDNLLQELGLGNLPKEEKADFLKHMYETLEMRVGTRLAERMSEAQMSEFEQFIGNNDEQGAFQWLEGNFPDYKDVVAEEFSKLKVEIKPVAEHIVAASAAAQGDQAQVSAPAATDAPVRTVEPSAMQTPYGQPPIPTDAEPPRYDTQQPGQQGQQQLVQPPQYYPQQQPTAYQAQQPTPASQQTPGHQPQYPPAHDYPQQPGYAQPMPPPMPPSEPRQ